MPKMSLIIGSSAAVALTATIITLAFGVPATAPIQPVHALAVQTSSSTHDTHNLFVDPSIKGHPDAGAMYGDGQTLVFKYDGSKSESNSSAVLSYDLYYIRDDGTLALMGGGPLDGQGSGDFRTASVLFNHNALGRQGIMELSVVYTAVKDKGKTDAFGLPIVQRVVLGRFAITYDIVSVRY